MSIQGTSRNVSHDDHDNGSVLVICPLSTLRPVLTVTPLILKALMLTRDKSR